MAFTPIISSQTVSDEIVNSGFQYTIAGSTSENTTFPDAGYQALPAAGNADNAAADTDNNYSRQDKIFTSGIAPESGPPECENINSTAAIPDVVDLPAPLTLPAFSSDADASPSASRNAAGAGAESNITVTAAEAVFAGNANISVEVTSGNSTDYKILTSGGGINAEPAANFANYIISGSNASTNLTTSATLSGTGTYRVDNTSLRAIDADKTGVDDTNLCWAGTASNMLYWAGWGKDTGSLTVSREDDLLTYFQQNFTDKGGWIESGIEWFLDGTYNGYEDSSAAQLEKSGGGGFFPSITVSDYLRVDRESTTVMTSLDTFLKSGDVCGLSVSWHDDYGYRIGGHAITCWGFTYNTSVSQSNKSYYTGVWISDSDDNYGEGVNAPDIIRYCPVSWSSADQTYILTYEPNYYGTIDGVIGLAPESGYQQEVYTVSVYNTVSGETVHDGTQTVFAGGVTLDNIIMNAGVQIVSSGGVTSGTVISSGGSQIVSAAGAADSTVINSGGNQYVSSGGTENSTVINSGGNEFVFAAGTGNSATVNSGGSQIVSSGGTATSTTINSGGSQIVFLAGKANSTAINAGGSQIVSSNGAASSAVINGGQYICFGGAATGAIVNNGGAQNISSGGVANLTTINSGGNQSVSSGGAANSTTINSGGSQLVSSGGMATSTNINSNGLQWIYSGGSANVIFQQDGAGVVAYTGAKITSGINSRVDGHRAFSIVSGVASNFLLENGGRLYVLYGNSAVDTIIASRGSMYISSGGMANLTTVNSGGNQLVYSSGTANSTTVNSGGSQIVSSGGTANLATINSGGKQYVSPGGTVHNIVVSSGGSMYVSSGGNATGTLTIAGGDVILANAAAFSSLTSVSYILAAAKTNDVLLTVNGGTLGTVATAYSLILDNAAAGSYILADSADLNSMKTKTFSVTYDSQTLNLTVGSSYTFSSGDKLSLNFTSSTRDQITAVLASIPKITVTTVSDAGEPDKDGTLRISRTGSTANALTVYFSIDGTATNGSDYTLKNGTTGLTNSVVIAAGQSSADITVGIIDDAIIEGTETAVMTLTANDAYSFLDATSSATVNVGDNDDTVAPTLPGNLKQTVTARDVAFDWADSSDSGSGLSNYLLQYALNNQFTGAVQQSVTVSSADLSNLAEGVYYWRVQAADKAGNVSDWVSGGSFAVDTTAPSVPVTLTQTANGKNITFDWADGSDATSGVKQYEVQIDDNSDFSSLVSTLTPAESIVTATGLPDSYYYWRVRTLDNSDNYSDWSSVSSFMFDSTPPTVPGGLLRSVSRNSVVFDWSDSSDAYGVAKYNLQIDNNNDFGSPVSDTLLKASNSSVSSMADGIYYWRVKAQDNTGNWSAWTVGDSFTVDTTKPTVPAGLTRTLNGKNVALDWNDASDATSGVKQYEVQVDNSNSFTTPEYFKQVAASQAYVENLAAGSYYWRIRTQDNSSNWSIWSEVANFTVELAPPTVPAGLKQTVTGSSAALDWNDSTDASGISLYEIREDNNSDFSSPEYSRQVAVSEASVTNLALGTYYWQVRSLDNSGNYSAWSKSSSFIVTPVDTVGNTTSDANVIGELASGVVAERSEWVGYGDPADYYKLTLTNDGALTLNLTGLSGDANLSLLDNKGKVLKTSANKKTADETIAMPLLAGDYFVKVAPADGGKSTVNNTTYTLSNKVDYFPGDNAGDTSSGANVIGELADGVVVTRSEWVGFGDPADYYKLTLTNAGALTLNLTGLSSDANLTLLDSKGKVLKTSANKKTADEVISTALAAGDYFVKVAPADGGKGTVNNTNYTLSNYFLAETAGNSFAAAVELASAGTVHGWVGTGNKEDYYKIEVLANGATITGGLSGFASNINLYVYDYKHKLVTSSTKSGLNPESIDSGAGKINAGTYYVKVMLAGTASTEYDLNFNLTQPGGLSLSGSLTGSADTGLTGEPLKKDQGILAS